MLTLLLSLHQAGVERRRSKSRCGWERKDLCECPSSKQHHPQRAANATSHITVDRWRNKKGPKQWCAHQTDLPMVTERYRKTIMVTNCTTKCQNEGILGTVAKSETPQWAFVSGMEKPKEKWRCDAADIAHTFREGSYQTPPWPTIQWSLCYGQDHESCARTLLLGWIYPGCKAVLWKLWSVCISQRTITETTRSNEAVQCGSPHGAHCSRHSRTTPIIQQGKQILVGGDRLLHKMARSLPDS